MFTNPVPFLIGLAFLFVLWLLYAAITGNWNPLKIIEGADGRPSTSKLQFFLWTAVALFSYAALYAARVIGGGSVEAISEIPHNLLIAMGLSIGTATAAKTVTSSFVDSGKITKAPADNKDMFAPLLQDDGGAPDLSKMQMLAWTAAAIAIYLITVGYKIGSIKKGGTLEQLPDIDAALMVLMGLGQAAYLGKKLVTTSTPRISGLSPNTGAAGTPVILTGLSFGDSKDGNQVTYDGKPIDSSLINPWADTSITFKVPDINPDGKPWPAEGQKVLIGVITNGQEGANSLPFVGKPKV